MKVPERENDQAGDDEDGGKSNKDVVTGVPPPSIVEHLSRLSRQERLFNNIYRRNPRVLHKAAVSG